ncbi:hypothetical protein RirG_109140 [Rhizophagus irregularis DAOM 197198w]|uniref:Uncharacterized protein n=1 Tax=Rhizophagus irregularis (strain DAOM 197198w) TaxID=1432141 RepID=A0A015MMD2_RHIIW|nr:hypothetical protein RirG_109140 [Rhizophagus irregularis DAOM 197198w]
MSVKWHCRQNRDGSEKCDVDKIMASGQNDVGKFYKMGGYMLFMSEFIQITIIER